TGRDFIWETEVGMADFTYPENAYSIERREWGNFYGYPVKLTVDGQAMTAEESGFWEALQASVERSIVLHDDIKAIERRRIGRINTDIEALRLDQRRLDLSNPTASVREAEEAR